MQPIRYGKSNACLSKVACPGGSRGIVLDKYESKFQELGLKQGLLALTNGQAPLTKPTGHLDPQPTLMGNCDIHAMFSVPSQLKLTTSSP